MFGQRLKALRKARGITQAQLADIIGVTQSAIGKYEGGNATRLPSSDIQRRIASYFNVSIDYLLGSTDELRPSFAVNDQTAELIQYTTQLNSDGMDMLLSYAHMLLGMPKYAKDAPTGAAI